MSRPPYKIFFGDIHNHNAHGYGVGSIERSVDVARTHLDFFAFTGHSSWHDLEPMEGGREQHWLKGFARLQETWPRVQRVIADANRDGDFSAFLGFEWHSYAYGDQCVVFPEDSRPLHFCDTIEALRRFCVAERALMIPHHLAYPRARRGVNWDVFTEEATPVVEIYSEHGNSEDDRGPFPMVTHSFGGRESRNTVKAALANGLRFGFVGSSDNHAGFPGAYGEGLMAALCRDLTRDEIFAAIHARRTYALTGDRIELDIRVDGAVMGSTIDAGRRAEVAFEVTGRDELDIVEVIQDGTIVHRAFAAQNAPTDGVFQVRFEWGWGPWAALALDRVTDWEIALGVRNGRLRRFFPCLQSGPFDEERRHRFERQGESGLSIRSYTSRKGAYRENPNQSVVLEIEGGRDPVFDVAVSAPAQMTASATLTELEEGSRNWQAGPFPKESFQFHRIVPRAASSLRGACTIDVPQGRSNVYVRVRQLNGHMAWASPIFMNYR